MTKKREARMPIYRLCRESDNEEFDAEARDNEHAVSVFTEKLGVGLTLEEGPAGPQYMMGRIPQDVHWAKPLNIPVWEIPVDSN